MEAAGVGGAEALDMTATLIATAGKKEEKESHQTPTNNKNDNSSFDTGDIFEVYATATGATLWTGSDNLDEWLPINQDRLWGMYSESIEPFPLNAVVTIQIREILNPSNISIQSVFSCSILNEAN